MKVFILVQGQRTHLLVDQTFLVLVGCIGSDWTFFFPPYLFSCPTCFPAGYFDSHRIFWFPSDFLVPVGFFGSRQIFWFTFDFLVHVGCFGSRQIFWFTFDFLVHVGCFGSRRIFYLRIRNSEWIEGFWYGKSPIRIWGWGHYFIDILSYV